MSHSPVTHQKIKIDKTAHFYTLGKFSKSTRYIWLACHGYGQTADRFIRKFEVLDLSEHFIIAPEGLSRFYWNGVKGHVAASWMTSKDRLDEIDDHVRFLNATISRYLQEDISFIFFGFSQGCATILRYLERFLPKYTHIVLWAGSIPKDLNFEKVGDYLRSGNIHMIYGDQDEFLTQTVLKRELDFIEGKRLKIRQHTYAGTHRVDREVLKDYVEKNIAEG